MSSTKKPPFPEKVETKEKQTLKYPSFQPSDENGYHPLVNEQSSKDIWMLILAFRFINTLCVKTFFQPDEYFQSLEPAWQVAFGSQSGAWITWVWILPLGASLLSLIINRN